MGSAPILRVVLAGTAAAIGLPAAAVASNATVRVLAVVAAALIVFACVMSLRAAHPRQAVATLIVVPVTALLVGIPSVVIAGAQRTPVAPGVGDPGFTPDAQTGSGRQQISANPNAQVRDALDRADRLVANGSATVLNINARPDWLSVAVLDTRTGEAITAARSFTGAWNRPTRRRATDRTTFSRAEIADANLDKARANVFAVAAKLKMLDKSPHASDGITVKRRYQDGKLVAEFSISGEEIEVDQHGRVADTAAAASLDTMLPLAHTVMVDAGLDPNAHNVGGFDYRAFDDAASTISASAVQNSGGFAIDFVAGPIDEIVVVPGAFPLVRWAGAGRRSSAGFALNALSTDTLLAVRTDLMARAKAPAYDADLIGLAVGRAPGVGDDGAVIRMQVGPSSQRAAGVYTLEGRWLRDGRW